MRTGRSQLWQLISLPLEEHVCRVTSLMSWMGYFPLEETDRAPLSSSSMRSDLAADDCRCSWNGGTQTCQPTAQGVAHFNSQVRPSAASLKTRPSREPIPREGDNAKTLEGRRPPQVASRGAEIPMQHSASGGRG